MRSRSSPSPARRPISSSRATWSYGSDCQTRSVSPPSSASRCQKPQRAEPAVLVVHGGHSAGRGDPESFAHRVDELVVGPEQEAVAEPPRRLLAQDAGRLAVGVDLDDASLDLEIAVRLGERGRVEPERVVVAGHERGRRVAGDRVELLPRGLDGGRPVAAPPAASAKPAAGLDGLDRRRPRAQGPRRAKPCPRGAPPAARAPTTESARARR